MIEGLSGDDRRRLREIEYGIKHRNMGRSLYDIVSLILELYGDSKEWNDKMKQYIPSGEPEYMGVDGGLTGSNGSPHVAGGIGVGWVNVANGGSSFTSPFHYGTIVFAQNFGMGWNRVTNNQAEVAALAIGLATVPHGWPGILVCDSKLALAVIQEPEKPRDWIRKEDCMLVDYLANRANCTYSHINGHTVDSKEGEYLRNTDPRLHVNYMADSIAKNAIKTFKKEVDYGTYYHPDGTLKRRPGWNTATFNGPKGYEGWTPADTDGDGEPESGADGDSEL